MSKLARLMATEEGFGIPGAIPTMLPIPEPALSLHDFSDLLLAYAVLGREHFSYPAFPRRITLAYLCDFYRSEFAGNGLRSMLDHHFLVVLMRHPRKVFDLVVCRLSIQMRDIREAVRIWKKRHCHESMDKLASAFPLIRNHAHYAISPFMDCPRQFDGYLSAFLRFRHTPGWPAPASHTAIWMDLVKTISRYLSPHMTPRGLLGE